MSSLLLRGGRLIDPSTEFDGVCDLRIASGKISERGPSLPPGDSEVRDLTGLTIVPGFVDLHVHFREPGFEYKEDILSGARAAAAGGFTSVCCMPNTDPVNDNHVVTSFIVARAAAAAVRVYPIGAISRGLEGQNLAEFARMKEAGIVAVSDDGRGVMDAGLMRRALEYAHTLDLTVVQHAEDRQLSQGGVMNEGAVSTRIGLRGQPTVAESSMVVRDLELVAWTGARYHLAHISTEASVRAVRAAKDRGLPVTCEVTPHHLELTDEACATYGALAKCAPPLRSRRDVEALCVALADGTIDCIATDHAPHALHEKQVEFDSAAFGLTGLETALGIGLKLVADGKIGLVQLIDSLTRRPAKIFGLPAGTLAVGAHADIAILDLRTPATFLARHSRSKSRNTPFDEWQFPGRVVETFVGGKSVFQLEKVS